MKRKRFTAAYLLVKRTRINKKQNFRDVDKNPAIVQVACGNNLSLFRAVRLGMLYHENGGGKWDPAERYARSIRLSIDAFDLRELVGETSVQTSYELDDVKKVYGYLEKTFPETYRILVFGDASLTQTVYNSGNNAKYNICLYYRDGHFDLMKTPQKFFRKKHYCADCETTYENLKGHSNCKIRCSQCFRTGYGYPCKGEETKTLECPVCHKFFPNQDCMDAHRPYSCNTFHRCALCNVQYRVRPESECKGHRCSKKVGDAGVTIVPRALLAIPDHLEKDKTCYAKKVSTRLTHHRGVQQDIRTYMTRN